jgi:hypothetical protein
MKRFGHRTAVASLFGSHERVTNPDVLDYVVAAGRFGSVQPALG